MSFGRKQQQDPAVQEAGSAVATRAGRVANALLILVLVLPIVTAASIFVSVNFHLWRATPSFDPLLTKIESAQRASGVVSGDDAEALKRLFQRLEGMTAQSAEARNTDMVHVLFHAVSAAETTAVTSEAQAKLPGKSDPQAIALDLSNIGASAVVLIADRPALLQISGALPSQRAKIGVEGPFAFDLAGARDGLLAGFRVGAFGAGDVASPGDYSRFPTDRPRQRLVCAALDRWQRYFGIPRENLRVWSTTNARRIEIGQRSVKADTRIDPDGYGATSVCPR
ncbi:hypothetical protein AB4Z40_25865 [Bosea sp. 2YAB26]|uniref:hypothetical protein n=1 Tax=Bosea sp. 2YAB26 TaxID=3237478 RepID=UPI003F9001F4